MMKTGGRREETNAERDGLFFFNVYFIAIRTLNHEISPLTNKCTLTVDYDLFLKSYLRYLQSIHRRHLAVNWT